MKEKLMLIVFIWGLGLRWFQSIPRIFINFLFLPQLKKHYITSQYNVENFLDV